MIVFNGNCWYPRLRVRTYDRTNLRIARNVEVSLQFDMPGRR
jgi:hypothetical protein